MNKWPYAEEYAWHSAECDNCGCARDQHEDDGCYGGCPGECGEFIP